MEKSFENSIYLFFLQNVDMQKHKNVKNHQH